jgi:hypothetical protein
MHLRLKERDPLLVDLVGPLIAVYFDVIEDSELNSHATSPLLTGHCLRRWYELRQLEPLLVSR